MMPRSEKASAFTDQRDLSDRIRPEEDGNRQLSKSVSQKVMPSAKAQEQADTTYRVLKQNLFSFARSRPRISTIDTALMQEEVACAYQQTPAAPKRLTP